MKRPLVILAAGMGRRYGGLKQLAPVGPHCETIMDYTVYDALWVGFDSIILVIRREIEEPIKSHVSKTFGRFVKVQYVFQNLEAGQPTTRTTPLRTKPWGSVQAVLATASSIGSPFAAANADDYYGRPAFRALADFLFSELRPPTTWATVGFEVRHTLPARGEVTRGLIQTEGDYLKSIREIHTFKRHQNGVSWSDADQESVVPGTSLVSMNLWGFTPEVFPILDTEFRHFLQQQPNSEEEYCLPTFVDQLVKTRDHRVRVLGTQSRWCGLTSADDLTAVQATILQEIETVPFPRKLWP